MAHAQKPDLFFQRHGRVYLNWRGEGGQFSRLLAAEVCASAVIMAVMLDTPCSEVGARLLATHSTRMFSLHFPYRASPCAIRFQLSSTTSVDKVGRPSVRSYTSNETILVWVGNRKPKTPRSRLSWFGEVTGGRKRYTVDYLCVGT